MISDINCESVASSSLVQLARTMEYIWRFLLVQAVVIESIHSAQSPVCDVSVSEPPWQTEHLFVPELSTIHMKCTSDSNSTSPFWLVDLANDALGDAPIPFSSRADLLNTHGVYEFPPINKTGMPPTVGLLINDTAKNNGTEVLCIGDDESFKMKLFVFDLIPITLEESGKDLNSINISWNQLLPTDSDDDSSPKFSLQISNRSMFEVVLLNKTNHTFAIPKNTPPCEVYNFSVTATYVGATYTGAGCNVPSPVLSTMLPSLPDIKGLETSLDYSIRLTHDDDLSKVVLNVSFEPARSCDQFPVLNYSVEIMDLSNRVTVPMTTVMSEDKNIILGKSKNLNKNTAYSFTVMVSNMYGSVSTDINTLYTADVQRVVVVLLEKMNALKVQCDFITGSTAQGCMVVLVGELGNMTLTLESSNPSMTKCLDPSDKVLDYQTVLGFAIEADGAVGSLGIPGELIISHTSRQSQTLCKQYIKSLAVGAEKTSQLVTIGVPIISTAATIILLLIIIIIIGFLSIKFHRKYRSKRVQSSSGPSHTVSDREFQKQSAEALYDEPHIYHILEEKTDSQQLEATNPIYDEITAPPTTRAHHSSQFKLDTELPSGYSTVGPHTPQSEETFV